MRLTPGRANADKRKVPWIVIVLIVVAVVLGLALLWREAHEMERGEGPPALTRQRALGTWVLLVLRFLFPWR